MTSIRTFLIIIILSTLTLVLFLSTLNGYQASMAKAETIFDQALADKASLLLLIFNSSKQYNVPIQQSPIQKINFVFQVWQNKQLLLKSPSLPNQPIIPFKQGFHDHNFLDYRWRTYTLYNNINHVWIITAERIDLRYVLAEQITLKTILPIIIMLPILGILIWLIVGIGLSPLKKLSIALEQKQMNDLTALRIDNQPTELKQVFQSINGLLKRLKQAFEYEKNITSDAAHELRTPISAIKIHLHNLSHHVNNPHFKPLKVAVERMEHLIEQILDFNRTSPEQAIARFKMIDIYQISQNIFAREYAGFEQKSQRVALEGKSAHIQGDQFALEVLVRNLLSNARKYTPNQGKILLLIEQKKQQVILEVHDSGSGIPKEKIPRIFDRFYRLDGDHHNSGVTGCGLGLAIVAQIVELHQATIELQQSKKLNGLKVQIIFQKQVA